MRYSARMFFLFGVVFLLSFPLPAQDNNPKKGFSVKNLQKLPSYERYEFRAQGTTLKETPVIIEYSVEDKGDGNGLWHIHGSMPLEQTLIDEKYTVRLRDLNILEYSRTQTYKRGTHVMKGTLNVDIFTGKPDEFVIASVQPIMYLLRTFPLNSDTKEIFIRLPQQQKGKMNLRIRNRGIRKLDTEKFGRVDAYVIEVSLVVPVVGMLLPNIEYYFLNDEVHTLVAMKGAFSMTGKNMEVHLIDYQSR